MNYKKEKVLCLVIAVIMAACGENPRKEAELMLNQAERQFGRQQYDRALITIDSIRELFPTQVDVREKALRLQQDIALKHSQEELAIVDSALQATKQEYEQKDQQANRDKALLTATPKQLTELTKLRLHRDSLQTRFDLLCAKIRYIHKKQKEWQEPKPHNNE